MLRRGSLLYVATGVGAALVGSIMVATPASAADSCSDFALLGAIGTDGVVSPARDGLDETTFEAADKLRGILQDAGKTVSIVPVDYPAVGLGPSFERGASGYSDSVRQGAEEVLRLVGDQCSDTEVVLIGYSQGAEVITSALIDITSSDADRVAGALAIGNPKFDPHDDGSIGTYNPERAGLFGLHRPYNGGVQAPAISVCRAWDVYCQGRRLIQTFWGGEIALLDSGKAIDNNKNRDINYEHGRYVSSRNTDQGACELADRMGFPACGSHTAPAVDVAFLIDTTGSRFDVVEELQSRAEELISAVSHGADNTRYAVVSYGQGTVDNVTEGFTSSDSAAVQALEGLDVLGGQYGSIYSAIREVNSFDWRPGAKKITLTLSNSRACSRQICTTEAGTGIASERLLPDGARREGAYTLNNKYFFEAAGWSDAIDNEVRPGGGYPASSYIDPLLDNFAGAVVTPVDEPIQGTTETVAGMSGAFSADSLMPHYVDSPDRSLLWRTEFVRDLGTRAEEQSGGGGGGPVDTLSATRMAADSAEVATPPASQDPDTLAGEVPDGVRSTDNPDDGGVEAGEEPGENEDPGDNPDPGDEEEEQPPLPEDMGPLFSPEFSAPGVYDVILDAYLDGFVFSYTSTVQVFAVPTANPAAPYVTSYVNATDQTQQLNWTAGAGEPAVAFGFTDATGSIVEAVTAESETVAPDGTKTYTATLDLEDLSDPFELVAFNEIGSTPAIPMLVADAADYTHTTLDSGAPDGGEFTAAGSMTAELQTALDSETSEADLSGPYPATLTSPTGDTFAIDMSMVDAGITVDGDWSASFEFLNSATTSGQSVTALLDDGLADELFRGGSLDVQVAGQPIRILIAPSAETAEIDEFVIDSNSVPPTGPAAEFGVDPENHILDLFTSVDPQALTFIAEAADPLGDWSTATISNVRTWIGNVEVTNDLTGTRVWSYGEETVTDAGVTFAGTVAGDTPSLVRDFLQTGTVSFQVDGGAPTVLALTMSAADAVALYPDLSPPTIVGRTQIDYTQYADRAPWKPVVDWGTSQQDTRYLSIEGDLPAGLSWDWGTETLTGIAATSGTFPITVTAEGDSGQATKLYNIEVVAGSASPTTAVAQMHLWNNNGTDYLDLSSTGYFRTDNHALTGSLPVIYSYADQGFLNTPITNVVFTNKQGQPLPITGASFNLEMWNYSDGPDSLYIYAEDVRSTDTGSLASHLGDGGSITFQDSLGATNSLFFDGP